MAKASSWHSPVLSLVQRETLLSLACHLSELGAFPSALVRSEALLGSSALGPSKAGLGRLKHPVPKTDRLRAWLVTLIVVTAVGFWNWQLLLATSAGLVSMGLAYRMQTWNWQRLGTKLQQFLRRLNRLGLVAGTGAVVTFSIYVALAWVDSRSLWIALWALLQGLGTLAILGLLVWQIHRSDHQTDVHFNQTITDLTHHDPLKRLIAVHQLSQLAQAQFDRNCDCVSGPEVNRRIAEYFHLMLRRETEAVIQEALLDGLEVVEGAQIKLAGIPIPES